MYIIMSYIIYKVKKRKRKEKEYVKGIYRSVWELILLTNLLTLGEIRTPMLSYQEFKDQLRTLPQSITNFGHNSRPALTAYKRYTYKETTNPH